MASDNSPGDSSAPAHPPETVEGWYVLHQIFRLDRSALLSQAAGADNGAPRAAASFESGVAKPETGGWSVAVRLIGSASDLMLVHFRPTLEAIGDAQRQVARESWSAVLRPTYSFLSVTEAGLYHITAQLAGEASKRGGQVGDEEYVAAMRQRVAAEVASPHVQRRLYPALPADMPYVCFYPMSKRRAQGQNWYTLSLGERSRLMHAHGMTGRRYAGRVQQVISGAIGLDAWEWGVTLFAKDPLDFKKLVTDMRFDEVSAKYADFGDFYVGMVAGLEDVLGEVLRGP